MNAINLSRMFFLALGLVGVLAVPSSAQAPVTSADIQRLQDAVFDASREVAQLRSRDAILAGDLQNQLDDARDETIYLKVKLRKNELVTRSEYAELRDRIERIRSRARSDVVAVPPAARGGSTTGAGPATNHVPVGTEFDVRLQTALTSATALVEDRFEATTMVDLMEGSRVLVPAGSVMRGLISSVNKAGRIDRRGSLTVAFDRITIDGRSYPIRATVTQALESEGIRGEAGKIGAGAGVGAVIGAILGGAKGALAGVLIGGGGTIAATEGKDVELPPGTALRVRLDSGLDLR